MTQLIKTILVDDDRDYLASMTALLVSEGFEVFPFTSFREMNEAIHEIKPHILILDVSLPHESAFEVLPTLRKETNFGLILASGTRNLEFRVEGLERGADVYLTKPIDIRELKAIINSLYKRLYSHDTGQWHLNERLLSLRSPKGHSHNLTENECQFLNLLFKAKGKPVDKEKILEALGRDSTYFEEGYLHTLLSRLRKKVSLEGDELPIKTIRNLGYSFHEEARIE
jgi:DNA-binding response OmpR family regulator